MTDRTEAEALRDEFHDLREGGGGGAEVDVLLRKSEGANREHHRTDKACRIHRKRRTGGFLRVLC